ncbi:hypothetical protein POM88_044625 [Heracleum sosnowskyi]|uniref:HTH myb-type domain-containing protein n=1 Tax=Heracleum sosnowskyi TaxID=360622 RepID=A0AAD8M451_9APIA|nr:hypothetical protein POM88_044625 [Heracleum sosnowskyi]
MSSPTSLTSVPSQNNSHHNESYLDQLGFGQKHFEGFSDHLSMNPSYSMHKNYAEHQIHDSTLMTEHLPFCHQAPVVQHKQHLGGPIVWLQPEQQRPAAQPQHRVREEVLVVQLERPLFGMGKPRLHWTHELHARFVRAVSELGGSFSATPKGILKRMNVKGLTPDQIKSHLQKVRTTETTQIMRQGIQNSANSHSLQLSGQGSSTSRSNTAPVDRKGLESFQAGMGAYGKVLQSSETPTYYQNLMFAPMGDYKGNANGSTFGF